MAYKTDRGGYESLCASTHSDRTLPCLTTDQCPDNISALFNVSLEILPHAHFVNTFIFRFVGNDDTLMTFKVEYVANKV